MKRTRTSTRIGIIGLTGGAMILLGFQVGNAAPPTPTVKVPGPYPYETPMEVRSAPPVSDSSPLPSPAPFPYQESSPSVSAAQDHDSRTAHARRPLSAKAVREAAFKYNGVANFCGFLAALPANVSVFDPKLGKPRPLVQGGRVVRKNVVWFGKHKQAATHQQSGT